MRWRLGLQRLEFGVVGVVAAGAEIICPLARTGKISHPFPVNTGLPVLILRSMAFAAESIAFSEVDQIAVKEPQLVPILRIMAVETPSHRFGVMELDIGMFFLQLPLLSIDLHGGMAVAARVQSLGHRRRGELIRHCHCRGAEKKQQ